MITKIPSNFIRESLFSFPSYIFYVAELPRANWLFLINKESESSNDVFWLSSVSAWRNKWRKQETKRKSSNRYVDHFKQRESRIQLALTVLNQFQLWIQTDSTNIKSVLNSSGHKFSSLTWECCIFFSAQVSVSLLCVNPELNFDKIIIAHGGFI